jgi:hypothetical protein
MNATERAKVLALSQIRMPDFGYGARLILNLKWRMQNNATAPLSPNEKHLLDLCCWHYRNRLGGVVDFDLPQSEPRLVDYVRPDPKLAVQERMF